MTATSCSGRNPPELLRRRITDQTAQERQKKENDINAMGKRTRVHLPFTVGAHGKALFMGGARRRPWLLKDSARVPAVKGARFPRVSITPRELLKHETFLSFCHVYQEKS